MKILIVQIGHIENDFIERLRLDLERVFYRPVEIGKTLPEPEYAYNHRRNQYLSTAILNHLLKEKDFENYEKTLGIVDHDLYVPRLNFVFGQATQRVAIISLTRLREEFYGLSKNQDLFYKRTLTEAVHELGHTYGLPHCQHPNCVMYFSNSILDSDRKGAGFCSKCQSLIRILRLKNKD
ncbi:MAG: archaemetzincin family Zn-dependent metalloprotease [Thermodesulfobacteriota bacterium]